MKKTTQKYYDIWGWVYTILNDEYINAKFAILYEGKNIAKVLKTVEENREKYGKIEISITEGKR